MEKIGIITFHNSYNCGSMLETFAMQKTIEKIGYDATVIDFSSDGQKELYKPLFKCCSFKNVIKNVLLLPHIARLKRNNSSYESFKNKYFKLTSYMTSKETFLRLDFDIVIAGSDQIWNVTIPDFDDVYFLSWDGPYKRISYAASFGAKNPFLYYRQPDKLYKYLMRFNAISVREKNAVKWLGESLPEKKVSLVLDPTLLLNGSDYLPIIDDACVPEEPYLFFYAPSFKSDICKLVRKIAHSIGARVVTWSAKSYYVKGIYRYGFALPKTENPAVYLSLIKNASLVITTSFHGTIFSTIFERPFYVVKNGDMYGDDDRVKTLLDELKLSERLIECFFDKEKDYSEKLDYSESKKAISRLRENSISFLRENIVHEQKK